MSIVKTDNEEKTKKLLSESLACVYDFGLFPYALGDVLTWNINTTIRCINSGYKSVDIYICLDKKNPANFDQRSFINKNNHKLFFQELYSAFGTHPILGNIHIFHSRESLISVLKNIHSDSEKIQEEVLQYLNIIGSLEQGILKEVSGYFFDAYRRSSFSKFLRKKNIYITKILGRSQHLMANVAQELLFKNRVLANEYFKKSIYSHAQINKYFNFTGKVPLLQLASGCNEDINFLFRTIFAKKKVVAFHLRLRALDIGFGGEFSYDRDSSFLEWYSFLKESYAKYPDIHFVALGRLQEKPLDLLQLPNVTNLRMLGFGLGHELSLINRCDFFIGSSSGFAAAANFSNTPYCITKMNKNACEGYEIEFGQTRLPFGGKNQILSYESESSEALMSILKNGLALTERVYLERTAKELKNEFIDINAWLRDRKSFTRKGSTSSRFSFDQKFKLAESSYLIAPSLQRARDFLVDGNAAEASVILSKVCVNFPEVSAFLPQFLVLRSIQILCFQHKLIEDHIENCLNIQHGCNLYDEILFQIKILKDVLSSSLTSEDARVMLTEHLKKIELINFNN